MYLICFLLFLFLATLLFCIVQNKSPYDQAIDDLAQETVLTQYCTHRNSELHRQFNYRASDYEA